MRNMTGKARMMAAGMALGAGTAFLLAALAAGGILGGWRLIAVLLLIVLAGISGWMIGTQMRVKLERDRIWLEGYKEGLEKYQEDQRADFVCSVYSRLGGPGLF